MYAVHRHLVHSVVRPISCHSPLGLPACLPAHRPSVPPIIYRIIFPPFHASHFPQISQFEHLRDLFPRIQSRPRIILAPLALPGLLLFRLLRPSRSLTHRSRHRIPSRRRILARWITHSRRSRGWRRRDVSARHILRVMRLACHTRRGRGGRVAAAVGGLGEIIEVLLVWGRGDLWLLVEVGHRVVAFWAWRGDRRGCPLVVVSLAVGVNGGAAAGRREGWVGWDLRGAGGVLGDGR